METSFDDLKVPGPTVTALTRPFWDAAEAGRLVIQKCGSCGQYVFYPRALCPHCWVDALDWHEVCGQGRLKSFTEIWKPGHPGWIPAAPYVVGLVELAEGPTMLSHILDGQGKVRIGDRLIFAPTKVSERRLPCFAKRTNP